MNEHHDLLKHIRAGKWNRIDDELHLTFETTPEVLADAQPFTGDVDSEILRHMGSGFTVRGTWTELHPLHVQHVETESNVSRVARGLEPERFIDRIRVTRRFVQKK